MSGDVRDGPLAKERREAQRQQRVEERLPNQRGEHHQHERNENVAAIAALLLLADRLHVTHSLNAHEQLGNAVDNQNDDGDDHNDEILQHVRRVSLGRLDLCDTDIEWQLRVSRSPQRKQ